MLFDYTMKNAESKPLPRIIFIPLLLLIFIRPFFSGLAYPAFESSYQYCAIILAALLLSSEQRFRANLDTSPYSLGISLFLIGYVISAIFSINIANSTRESIRFISHIAVFFIVSQINSSQKNTLIKAIVTAAAIISAYSIYQYFFGYRHTLDYLRKTNSDFLLNSSYARDILIQKRAIGTFPSPNILAGYLIMMFFIAASSVRRTGQTYLSRSANGYGFSVAIIAIALLLTKSLGAYLSITFALLALFFIFYGDIKKKRLMIVIYIILIAFGLAFIILSKWDRLMNLENPHNPIMQRLNYWRTSVAALKDHPFLGIGPGNFQEAFLKYEVERGIDTRYSHNILLQTWLETGALGLISMVFLIITFIKKSFVKSRYLFLAGSAFMLHNLIDITYFIPEAGLFWWVLLGLTAV